VNNGDEPWKWLCSIMGPALDDNHDLDRQMDSWMEKWKLMPPSCTVGGGIKRAPGTVEKYTDVTVDTKTVFSSAA